MIGSRDVAQQIAQNADERGGNNIERLSTTVAEGRQQESTSSTSEPDIESTFTVLFEFEIDPEFGDDFHQSVNPLFLEDREDKGVLSLYGLRRYPSPITNIPIKTLQASDVPSLPREDDTSSTASSNVKKKDSKGESLTVAKSEEEGPTKSDISIANDQLPNYMTKGVYTDIDAFTRITSRKEIAQVLSDCLWYKKLSKMPKMSMWHRVNGAYSKSKISPEGDGSFFRMRRFILGKSKQNGRKCVVDTLYWTSQRALKTSCKESSVQKDRIKEKEEKDDKCYTYEVLVSNDMDRRNEVLDFASWNSIDAFLRFNEKPFSQKANKRIKVFCKSIEETFWYRSKDGLHLPIKKEIEDSVFQ